MTDLVEFLRAALDEDERVARAAAAKCPAPWTGRTDIDGEHPFVQDADGDRIMHHEDSVPEIETAAHIARHDPARVLAEVAAKRGLLAELAAANMVFAMRLLAEPYAGREGWRGEWAT
jgi:hypothetical protein